MSSRLNGVFTELKYKGRKALIPFITAGDPNLEETERIIGELERNGADVIELGIPFSDPMADGPIIQQASERAIKGGITLEKVLALVRRIRQYSSVPLVLMGYYNPILSYGLAKLARDAAKSGVDGFLVVDLPPEEAFDFQNCLKKEGLDLVFLVTPTSDKKRMQTILKMGSGYIYYVSLTGVTGAKLKENLEVLNQVKKIQSLTPLPVVVGFGISTPEQAQNMASQAQGIVIGSALVSLIEREPQKVGEFIKSIREALDQHP